MKIFIPLLLFCFCITNSFSQDLIVLKKDELVIKCRIISISDTSLTYTDWKNDKSDISVISRSDVLSYLIDTQSRKDNNPDVGANSVYIPLNNSNRKKIPEPVNNTSSDKQQYLLGIYKSNEDVEGYIVKITGDTIKGYISVKNVALNQIQVQFTDNTNDSVQIYTTNELNEYGYGNIIYKKIKSPIKKQVTNQMRQKDEFLFLHLIVDGPSELYRLFTLHFKSAQLRNSDNPPYYLGKLKTHYLITNINGDSICTKGRTLKGSMNRIYDDNKTVKEYIYKEGVNEARLPLIVEMYNSSIK